MNENVILLVGDLSEAERREFTDTFGALVSSIASADIRYAVVWNPPLGLLAQLPNLEIVFSLGAGVDHILRDTGVPDVPIVRFVDPDLTGRMVEWVVLQALLHLRRQREFDAAQADRLWEQYPTPAAGLLTVGIMGLGHLGRACAKALQAVGFQITGYVRSQRSDEEFETYGPDGFDEFLGKTDILVNLLPLTEETRGLINQALIEKLRKGGPLGGPVILNAGRGGSQLEADIAAALSDGGLCGVSLDVFENEPLSADSPLWQFPNAILTPHVAAVTDPTALVAHVSRQINRHQAGKPLENVVDRIRGY